MKLILQPSFRNLYAFGKKMPIDLSLSENPLGCSPKVPMVFSNLTREDIFDYPDPDCKTLVQAIADRFLIYAGDIFVANGSEAIIKLTAEVFIKPGDEVIIPSLTFPMFGIVSRINKAEVIFTGMTPEFDINLKEIESKITGKTKLIFICNPNNPTGRIIPKRSVLDLVRKTDAMVIVDEANIEFGGDTVIKETAEFKNLIVLRTFSKGFGLAGLRIGFCAANGTVIELFKRVCQPFPVSSVSQAAAVAALEDKEFLVKTRKFMAGERRFLTGELRNRGFKVIESEANNLLIMVGKPFINSTDLVRKLNENGVSVVDGANFPKFNGQFIRVSPRSRMINRQFLKALDAI